MCTFTKNLVFPCQENPYFWLCWVVCCILKGLYFKGKSIKGSHSFFVFPTWKENIKMLSPLCFYGYKMKIGVSIKSQCTMTVKSCSYKASVVSPSHEKFRTFFPVGKKPLFQTPNLFQYFSSIVELNWIEWELSLAILSFADCFTKGPWLRKSAFTLWDEAAAASTVKKIYNPFLSKGLVGLFSPFEWQSL